MPSAGLSNLLSLLFYVPQSKYNILLVSVMCLLRTLWFMLVIVIFMLVYSSSVISEVAVTFFENGCILLQCLNTCPLC